MRILIEGQSYFVEDLKKIFINPMFYTQKGESAIINSVGYYYSMDKKEVVYMLPKVFMSPKELKSNESENEIKCLWEKKNTVFKHGDDIPITIKELFYIDKLEGSIKHESKYVWIRHITISFYNSLIEFKRRKNNTTILNSGIINEINTNLGDDEYSYLDLVLSFTNFYKKTNQLSYFAILSIYQTRPRSPSGKKQFESLHQ